MEYRIPKVLEKKPMVGGFNIKIAVVVIIAMLVFFFTVFTNVFLALLVPILVAPYIHIQLKYPKDGEFLTLTQYKSGVKCIRGTTSIKNLIMIKKDKNE